MVLQPVSTQEMVTIYKERMVHDFPANELKPLKRIIETMKNGLCKVFSCKEGNELLAYAIMIFPEGGKFALLDYFAVNKNMRGKGIGHAFFQEIKPYMQKNYSEMQGIFIESEHLEDHLPQNEQSIRKKRIAFYLDCGCKLTQLEAKVFGVWYSVLYFTFGEMEKISYNDLDYIYKAMFVKKHYETQVKLWDTSL